jgi:triosephosphate isomerase
MERTLIVNFKNYAQGLGLAAIKVARSAEVVAKETGVNVIVAPSTPMLHAIAIAVGIPVFAQKADDLVEGMSTGAVIPESIKMAGGKGSLLNHSESRTTLKAMRALLPRMVLLSLRTCVCSRSVVEATRFAKLKPDYLALEPPELIGRGRAVSKVKPQLIERFVRRLTDEKYSGSLLCGAGIVDALDAAAAIRLGTEGILVASSVMKSKNPEAKMHELATALAR